ncbi:hypothetical protein ABBQ38_006948 [Trebouxia sp. C0009 RCD-2024]
MMLKSLLKPCHVRLSTRCWQKQGKHVWLQAHYQPACTESKSCRLYCRPRINRIATSCAVAEHPTNVAEELPELTDQRMSWRGRSIGCGDINETHIGQRVTVCGWVHRHRGLGGVVFCDIRDSSGLIQVVSQPSYPAHPYMEKIRSEYVVRIEGNLRARKDPNKKIPTGMVELEADAVTILNAVTSKLPFLPAEDSTQLSEEVRLKHRVLDLRRQQMATNLKLRHKVIRTIRNFLDAQNFLEVETPVLGRATPEGARDFLVPSRLQEGHFYALPQSPQVWKQLLCCSGVDRYYQIAPCFRDEDTRGDRQPSFTQMDLEMTFADQDVIMKLTEDLMRTVFKEVMGVQLPETFPRMTYAHAMDRYGCDKPDVRYQPHMRDVTDMVRDGTVRLFEGAIAAGGIVKALRIPNGKAISNARIKTKGDVANEASEAGLRGLVQIRVEAGGAAQAAKAITDGLSGQQIEDVMTACEAQEGDLLLFAAGNESTVNRGLDRVRQYIAKQLNLADPKQHALLWITDFPMFEWNEEEQRHQALHHPFTAPNQQQSGQNGADLTQSKALAYDLVYNGVEVGGKSQPPCAIRLYVVMAV